MKIAIVDDEELIRNGLAKMIARMELPATVIGTAGDGTECLKLVSEVEPDIVLTDIRMPHMDGLELIEQLARHYPGVRTVILSGYDDFEYAKQAIRLGCKDYLVKPPNYTELHALLQALYAEFSRERAKLLDDMQKKEVLHRNRLLLQTDYLRSLLARPSSHSPEDLQASAAKLDIHFAGERYLCALLKCERRYELQGKYSRAEWELLKYACLNIASELAADALCLFDEQEHLVLLLPDKQPYEDLCGQVQEVRSKLAHYLKLDFSAALSSPCPVVSLYQGYCEAKRLLPLRLVRDNPVLITAKDAVGHQYEDIDSHLQLLRELRDLELPGGLAGRLEQWLQSVKAAAYSPEALQRLEQELRLAITLLARQSPQAQAWLERLDAADSLAEYIAPVLQLEQERLERQGGAGYGNQAVERAIAYIRQHYRSSLNLASLSEHVHMNPAYFSVMFKKHTGLGVVEYITAVRIDAAKKLLAETDIKTYEIAEATGFHDPAYFSTIFKRQVGMTPQTYRHSSAIDSTRNQ